MRGRGHIICGACGADGCTYISCPTCNSNGKEKRKCKNQCVMTKSVKYAGVLEKLKKSAKYAAAKARFCAVSVVVTVINELQLLNEQMPYWFKYLNQYFFIYLN